MTDKWDGEHQRYIYTTFIGLTLSGCGDEWSQHFLLENNKMFTVCESCIDIRNFVVKISDSNDLLLKNKIDQMSYAFMWN